MQGRVEQPDGHRQPVHRLEDPDEVAPLQRAAARRGGLLLLGGVGEDHLRAPRHPLARRGTCARCGTGRSLGAPARARSSTGRGCRRWPARADAGAASATVITARRRARSAPSRASRRRTAPSRAPSPASGSSPTKTSPVEAVDRDHVALGDRAPPARERRRPRGRARSRRRRTPPACPSPRATTAACEFVPPRAGQDALRGDHAVEVVGRRLAAHEDHLLAPLRRAPRLVGGEHDLADRRAGRRVQALRDRRPGAALGVELRREQLVELARRRRAGAPRPRRSGPRRSMSTAMHTTRRRGALADARLQHPERPCSIVNSMSHMSR